MFHSHAHDHHHHDHGVADDDDDDADAHGHAGHHHHHHAPASGTARASPLRIGLRFAVAGVVCLGAVLSACAVMVAAGQAVVVTRFGDPVAVLTRPGLAWKLPMPIEGTIPVDLRLRTTSTGQQDVGTRDGLRILVQAFVAWRVPAEPDRVEQFLRTVRNDPDEAARQIRSLAAAALQVTASSFDLADLVNTDPGKQALPAFEQKLREQIVPRVEQIYGITITQVGIERLGLPQETLSATVGRMRAEREVVAAQVTTEGLREAAAIRSDAERDARVTIAQAHTDAAQIEADSQKQAAEIHARAYASDPQLYLLLRSLDTLGAVVGGNTRLVVRTDAEPFHMLIEGPPTDSTAVVTRFGRVVDVRGAGLLLAWPAPIDSVIFLPGPDQQLGLSIAPLPRAAGLDSAYTRTQALRDAAAAASQAAGAARSAPPPNAASLPGAAGNYLTGDGGVVLLDVTLTWRVDDPAAYFLAQNHVEPALDRLFRAAAVHVAAGHALDDFLVVDQNRAAAGRAAATARVRDEILAAINDRLRDAAANGASLGIEITRLDLTASLPAAAKLAFDSVLTATQVADQGLAQARTDDRLLNVARASAAERVSAARAHTDEVFALASQVKPENRENLLDEVYRDRIAKIVARIGQVTAVDPRGGPRLILPSTRQ
jgi:membrane protease subunit HflC